MITVDDIARRDAIADYGLIGAAPEADLQGIVRLAATVCDVDTAVVNLIDDRSQHQVAAIGFEPSVCAREDSMCAVVLQHPGRVIVSDASVDERFAQNPFVTGRLGHVRFYASSPLVTPDGVAIGTLCVFGEEPGDLDAAQSAALDLLAHQVVDVIELRRITRELERSNEQLARFAGQVSHDLRNPLTALAGFIELAVDDPEMDAAPSAARSLARAEAAADRMADMLSDLYEFARLGGAQPRHEQVELAEVVRSALDDLQTVIAEAGAVVEVDAPIRVAGDATLLRALFQNLIANAVKFSAASGATPRVEVRVEPAAGAWRITVDDNGPGIAVDERERVFGLMQRGGTREAAGLGIGLSTCRTIVQAHGGRIGIDESPAGGARVWVMLPAQ
ncbi:hypothetical protein GCM10025738_11740 [Microbacterium fluvii]